MHSNTHQPPRQLDPSEKTALNRAKVAHARATQYHSQVPIEHITQQVPFGDLTLLVGPQVLIPRPETELLVEKVLVSIVAHHHSSQSQTPISILDVGTGSGAIICSLATKLSALRIPCSLAASDVSQTALALARTNQRRNGIPRVHWVHSHLLTQVTFMPEILVANLPYIPRASLASIPVSVRRYEPQLALDGGVDGFRLIDALLKQLLSRQHQPEHIWLEIDSTHTAEIWKDWRHAFEIELHQDQFDRLRFAHLRPKTRS